MGRRRMLGLIVVRCVVFWLHPTSSPTPSRPTAAWAASPAWPIRRASGPGEGQVVAYFASGEAIVRYERPRR